MSRTDVSFGKLGRDTLTYGASFMIGRAASVVMLPIYTRYLTPADYGALHLVELTLDVTALLLREGITAACMRFYFKSEDETARKRTIATSFLLVQLFNAMASLLLFGAAALVAERMLGSAARVALVRLGAASLLFQAGFLVPTVLMQIRQRARLYLAVSLARLAMTVTLNVVFLVGLGMGARGPLLSTLVANVVLGIPLTIWTLRQVGPAFELRTALGLLRFGLPYRAAMIGAFVLTFGDRFFLKAYHDLDVVGLYGLAYQFGFLLVYVSGVPFLQAWNPQRFALAADDRERRDASYNRGLMYLSLLVVTMGVGISLFVRPLLAIIAAPAFHGAARLVPILVLAYAFQVWTDVVELGIQVSEKTRYAAYATWASVAVVLVLYATLIPRHGALGAALATLVAFAFRFACFYAFSHRVWPVRWQWGSTLLLLGYGGGAVAVSWAWSPAGLGPQLVQAAAAFAAFAALAWFAGGLRPDARRTLAGELRRGMAWALGTRG